MTKTIRTVLSGLNLIILSFSLGAQTPSISVITRGSPPKDSSYYDIKKVGHNQYWAIGKYGIFTALNGSGKTCPVKYPNKGITLFKMAKFHAGHIIISADKGSVYHYFPSKNKWKYQKIKGFENYCFYNICAIDSNTAFITGGKSKIAKSQMAIPNGFILRTTDGGKTWQTVFRSLLQMVWTVRYHPGSEKLYALTYSPMVSHLLISGNYGGHWDKQHFSGLYHGLFLEDDSRIMVGGKDGRINKNGRIMLNKTKIKYPRLGFFWSFSKNQYHTIIPGSKGNILYRNNSGKWKPANTPANWNLYEVAFIDDHSAFVVGSQRTILRIRFKPDNEKMETTKTSH